jgi:hypothetical protein
MFCARRRQVGFWTDLQHRRMQKREFALLIAKRMIGECTCEPRHGRDPNCPKHYDVKWQLCCIYCMREGKSFEMALDCCAHK